MTSNDEMPLKNDTAKIMISKNGPYIISGEIPIRRQVIISDSDGTATEWQSSTKYPRQKTCALCRWVSQKTNLFVMELTPKHVLRALKMQATKRTLTNLKRFMV